MAVTCNDFESIHNLYFHCFMSQYFLDTHILAFLAIMCVDYSATRLLVDRVGTLNVISDKYMNRLLYMCLIFPIFFVHF